jgi:hypothetical protein
MRATVSQVRTLFSPPYKYSSTIVYLSYDRTIKKLWFKRRRYGYGWTPVVWQGWLAILTFLAIVFGALFSLKGAPRNTFSKELALFLISVGLVLILLLIIARLKGPKPHWRWGMKKSDNPDEDF